MRRALVFLLLVVLFGFTFGVTVDSRAATRQSNSTSNSAANDSQTLHALLREMRELRQDFQLVELQS